MSAAAGLRAQVGMRRRRWLAARGVEALLVGGGVAALTLAAQRMSGPADARAAALVATLCAASAAAALLRERWRDERVYTRRLDARLGAGGALVTACELERRGGAEPLGALLAERTRAAMERARWRGAAAPPSPLFAAVLLGGLALFAAVGSAPAPAPWGAVEAALGALEGLAAEADPSEVRGALERLDAALAASDPTPAQARAAARRRADALATMEGRSAADPSSAGALASAPGAAQGSAGAAAGGAGTGSGKATLAAGAGDRTMSRPDGPQPMLPDSHTTPSAASGAPPARAVTWPRRHDPVVAGYLERLPRD